MWTIIYGHWTVWSNFKNILEILFQFLNRKYFPNQLSMRVSFCVSVFLCKNVSIQILLTHKTLTFHYSDYSVIAICMQYILCMLFFAFYAIDCPTLMYSANYFWFKSRSLKVFCFVQNSCFLQILKLRKKLLYLFLIEALVPFFLIHMDNRQNDLAKSESS